MNSIPVLFLSFALAAVVLAFARERRLRLALQLLLTRLLSRWRQHEKARVPLAILMMSLLTSGCGDTDRRIAQVATEAADRQARQSEQIAKSHTQLTEGVRHLVESAGRSQESLITVQKGLELQQAEVGRQRDSLEEGRQVLATQRRTEPIVAIAIGQAALLVICVLPLILCWLVLCRPTSDHAGQVMTQVLIEEIAGQQHLLLSGPHPKSAGPRLDFPRQPKQ